MRILDMYDEQNENRYRGKRERRSGYDRRSRQIPSFRDLLIHRRRSHLRREEDRKKIFIFDRYNKSDLRVVIAVLVLSVIDAFLTIYLMADGAVELNPIMAYFLNINAVTFMVIKYLLTALSVITVVILHYTFIRYFRFPTRYLLDCFVGIFALVVVWEIFLIGTHLFSS